MRAALSALWLLFFMLGSGSAGASFADPWFGRDKALHFGLSAVLGAAGYAAASPWLATKSERALAGGAFSLTLGAGKELWDLSGHGDASFRDFTWDVVGTAVGLALAVGVDALARPEPHVRVVASAQGLLLHF